MHGVEKGPAPFYLLRMPSRWTFHRFIVVTALLLFAGQLQAQARVTGYAGAAATGLDLRRLGTTARLLMIGAHPDDENTALVAPLALGEGADVAYLSLTRGEGGQNGIGPELGTALGILRSEELLAARRLDGGTQLFSRAIDYGFSKSADEAFSHWPRDSLVADVVAAIRRYRPDVVVSVWSGTPLDGHGQHQASGIVAREAVLAAGDPSRFPEQIAAGLRPFTPSLFYRSAGFGGPGEIVEVNTGRLDPLLGRSYQQVAMASRSRHRSQDQGTRQPPGPRRTAIQRIDPAAPVTVAPDRRFGWAMEGAPARDVSIFSGVDTLLSQRARSAAARARPDAVHGLATSAALLARYEALVDSARASFDPLRPGRILGILVRADERLRAAAAALPPPTTTAASPAADALADLRFNFAAEAKDLRAAILDVANVQLDAIADHEDVVRGQSFALELSVWNGGADTVRARVAPLLPAGWIATTGSAGQVSARPDGATNDGSGTPLQATRMPAAREAILSVAPGERATATFQVTVPEDAQLTTPYYLDPAHPATGDFYHWPPDPQTWGLPFAPAPVRASFALDLRGDADLTFQRSAAMVGVDRRSGEFRRPVKVVPEVSVAIAPELAVFSLDAPRTLHFTATLRSNASSPITGWLHATIPPGWRADPDSVAVSMAAGGPELSTTFDLTPPDGVAPGEYDVGVSLATAGDTFDLGYQVIDYPHIRPHHLYRPATARVRALDVRVADVRVGYVPGAGDDIPAALDQLGLSWGRIDAPDLASGDLGRFDVIVTGIRAYEVNDGLVAHNQRLLDWVRHGGTLIVQYNKYPALERDYTPWPVTIARPHGRVTDPAAPVTVLQPDNPIFTTPNRIGPADWAGWVQERGLYFWDTWQGPFTPLLAMSDPGEAPLEGSLLVAPLGDGTYVYAALAFFRQLPAGVPGAYRLFANLLSLGAPR